MSQLDNNTIKNTNITKLESVRKSKPEQGSALNHNRSLPHIGPQLDEDQSQFLELNQQMKDRLKDIDQKKAVEQPKKRRNSMAKKLNKSLNNKSLPIIEKQQIPREKKKSIDKKAQKEIKKQFVHKLKEWQRQKQQLEHKKQVLQSHKQKVKKQQQEKRLKEEQEEKQFHRLQKKKQLQQKIGEIEARRRMRQESLKNAVLKRSYHGVPKYLEYEQKFSVQEEQQALLDLKLMKSKKQKMKMTPQELKAHQKAYIDRIKERLNMKSPQKKKGQNLRQTNSDFNLYLKRSEQLKKVQLEKIIRRKKFQEKLNQIPIKVDEQKKQQILISKDKAKNPQKYHILERKALNDRQIYNEFMGVEIELDAKKKGNDYLNELKKEPKKNIVKHRKAAKSQQILRTKSPKSLPKIQKKRIIPQPEQPLSERLKPRKQSTVRSFSQMSVSKSYERSLLKAKQQDSKYMSVLRDKLAMLD